MRFVIFQDTDGQWRFRMVAANNRTVAQSEGYRERRRAMQTARAIIDAMRGSVPEVVMQDR